MDEKQKISAIQTILALFLKPPEQLTEKSIMIFSNEVCKLVNLMEITIFFTPEMAKHWLLNNSSVSRQKLDDNDLKDFLLSTCQPLQNYPHKREIYYSIKRLVLENDSNPHHSSNILDIICEILEIK